MFSLDFFLCQFHVCLFASVFMCVHLLIFESRSLTSVSVCECCMLYVLVHMCVSVCECVCMHAYGCAVSSFDPSSVFSVASPDLPCSLSLLPSIPHCLPPHVAPSPVGVDTERPKSALLTPHCYEQLPGLSSSTLETHSSLHHFTISI